MHLFYRRHFLGEPGETKHQSEEAKRARLTALRQGALNISNTHHRQLWVLKRRAFEVEQQTPICATWTAAAKVFVFFGRRPTTKWRERVPKSAGCREVTRTLDEIYIITRHVGVPENSALLLECSCHCSPAPAFEEKAFLILSELLMRSFTDNLLMLSPD